MKYRAISLWQPWATLIAVGAKQFETRSWAPRDGYRGAILIHAAKKWDGELKDLCGEQPFARVLAANGITVDTMPLGCVVAVANLTRILRTEVAGKDQTAQELAFGDWSAGRFAWKMENVQALAVPIPLKGMQGIFTAELDLPDLGDDFWQNVMHDDLQRNGW